MGDNSKIEWTQHTFNPWWGCARVSPGCRFCYADTLASRWGHEIWRRKGPRRMLSEANWAKPLKWNRDAERAGVPARVFCASMADVFEDHPDVTEARKRLWGLIEATPWLRWQLLTKRPQNVPQMVPWGGTWPSWVWLGTSVENQRYADERIDLVAHLRGPHVVFLSCEPLLGRVDLSRWLFPEVDACTCGTGPGGYFGMHERGCGLEPPELSWVICGGESGAKARPMDPAWARSLRDQCQRAGVPYLFKQWGEWAPSGAVGTGNPDARRMFVGEPVDGHGCREEIAKVGKSAAGRILDGRTWDEYPDMRPAVAS